MRRNFSGWGVIFFGLLLALGGIYGLWAGWDLIQLERGWSQFIAGSVALSGGVITIALGRILSVLASHKTLPQALVDKPIASEDAIKPLDSSGGLKVEASSARTAPKPLSPDRQNSPPPSTKLAPAPETIAQPQTASIQGELEEVDRYSAGDSTYIMFSDGSVEVRKPTGSQRFPSLAALRAATGAKRR